MKSASKNLFTLLSVLKAALVSQISLAQWATVGNPGFSSGAAYQNSIAFDADKNLYVAYSDAGYGQRVTVKKLVSGTWVTQGSPGFAGGQGGQTCSMVITSEGAPLVAVIGGSELHGSVWKLNLGAWVQVGLDISDEIAGGIKMAITSDDVPYVLYRDEKSYDNIHGRATVKKFNGVTWELVGNAGFSDDFIQSLDIAIDRNDVPYVAYEDGGHSLKATVKKFNGLGWESVGATSFTGLYAKFISLAINNDNTPYLAFKDGEYFGWAKCMKFNGTVWEVVGTPVQGLSATLVSYVSLGVDQDNVPYVAYKSELSPYSISIKKYNGSSWELVGNANFTGNTAAFVNLTFDAYANPYVSYQDGNNGFRLTVAADIINNPLPVKLISFQGKYLKNENAISLSWSTTIETDNHHFDIESSLSAIGFQKIGEVSGNGNSSSLTNYHFIDDHLGGSTIYYRLKQTDRDGSFSYSRIISVTSTDQENFYILGNPVYDNVLRIRTVRPSPDPINLGIYNVMGQQLRREEFTSQKEYRIGIHNLRPGTYILRYKDQVGVQSKRFVKY